MPTVPARLPSLQDGWSKNYPSLVLLVLLARALSGPGREISSIQAPTPTKNEAVGQPT